MIPRDELAAVMRIKQALVHDVGQRIDLSPLVVHHREGAHVATLNACGGDERPGTALPLISLRLGAAGFDSDEIAVACEVHARYGDGPLVQALEDEPGALAREYAADPLSDVREAIAVVYVQRGCDEASLMTAPYGYTDHGGVLAVEFDVIDGPVLGDGPLMRQMIEAANLPPDDPARRLWRHVALETEATSPQLVAHLLVTMFHHGVMVVKP